MQETSLEGSLVFGEQSDGVRGGCQIIQIDVVGERYLRVSREEGVGVKRHMLSLLREESMAPVDCGKLFCDGHAKYQYLGGLRYE